MRARFATLVLALLAAFRLPVSAQLTRAASSINLPSDLPSATGYTTANAFPTLTFSAPMQVVSVPGETNRMFVAERFGNIQLVTNPGGTPTKTGYLSISSLIAAGETLRTDGENGLLSVVFHPNFATNRTLYVYFSLQANGQLHQRLHQVTVSSATASTVTITQHKPLLTVVDRATNHNGGTLGFGPDGYLYLSMGDEGDGGDSFDNARYINTQLDPVGTTNRVMRTGFWGKIHRIAVEVDPVGQPGVFPPSTIAPNPQAQNSTNYPSAIHGNYRVPTSNPFHGFTSWHNVAIDPNSVRTEIFATGVRNPFRWSFDSQTGRLFLGDVGQGTWEEVDIVTKGGDYGWSWREGNHTYNSPPAPTSPPAQGFNPIAPIYEYDHTNSGSGDIYGNVICGGMVYRSGALSELYGKYIFADEGSGYIVALTENANGTWSPTLLCGSADAVPAIVNFSVNPGTGEMLMCNLNSGTLLKLTRKGTTGTSPPATLSATGAFSNLATLTPATGVIPYTPNVAFWSDYAIKSRWFAIKNLTDSATFNADGNWTLPTGMIWVKHFDIDTTRGNAGTRRKLETRFLVKTANGVYGLSYKWRADQTDADLVAEDGLTEVIPSSSPSQTWRYPSRTECNTCHSAVGGFALSFNTRQLNRTQTYGAQTLNQIAELSRVGYLTGLNASVNNLPAHVAATDNTASLEARVRSYLAVNCVQCHQPGGAATGNWDARITTPTDSANLINGALVNNAGDAANRWLVPADTAHSMVLKRLQGNGVQRMPPLATNERDLTDETLVTDWINSLAGRQSFADWQATQFTAIGGPSAPGAQPDADPDFDGLTNRGEYLLGHAPLTFELPYLATPVDAANTFTLNFQQPANRSVLVETSTDLHTWSLWDVPGNTPSFPATPRSRTLTGPKDTLMRAFRLNISGQ